MTNKSEIDELKAKVNALERQISGADVPSEKEIRAWQNEMHQLAERRASQHNPFTKDQLKAFRVAGSDAQAIVHDHRNAPQGPASIIPRTSQPASNVRGPVNTTGWQHQIPLRNGLGQGK